MGFRVKYDPSIFNKYWSMAGHDKERAAQINRMFADKEVKAVFCAQAGYGSIRVIPYLNKRIIRRNPKIFIGYSDITILLYYLHKISRMVVFHGPVVSEELSDINNISLDYLTTAITQPKPLGSMQFSSMRTLKPGIARGVLVGGNMSMMISAIGTPYDMNTENKILFLEEIDEDLEVIDNYIMHLKMAGKFRKVKGIVFGRMIDCFDSSEHKYSIGEVLRDSFKGINIPIIYGFPSGHRTKEDINIALPLGVSVTLDAERPALVINEAAVR
ncbi:MAG: LD-carboxypeptidase, partial [Candidatus Omnitrophica bacterium]|nr:LD-carboxypeptidase [Candidatus Omnitrophota bacterium]